MRGKLEEMSLTDLVQLVCNERKTALIRLERGTASAEVWAEGGDLVHAVTGPLRGRPALFEAFGWETGRFELVLGRAAEERTLSQAWPELLLEAAEQVDLRRSLSSSAGGGSVSASSPEPASGDWLRLAGISEVRGSVLARCDGMVEQRHGEADADQLAALAVVAFEAGAEAGEALGLGREVDRLLIETAEGRVLAVGDHHHLIAALLHPATATEGVEEVLRACLK